MNLKIRTRKNIALFLGVILILMTVLFAYSAMMVHAAQPYTIRVPADCKVYVSGNLLGDDKLSKVDTLHGRIHDIAAAQLGANYNYKEYIIESLASMDDLQVFDLVLNQLTPKNVSVGFIDYIGASEEFVQSVNEIVTQAAIAYTNRVNGKGNNGALSKYFRQGSDAYNIAVNSDAATKWGRFMSPGNVATVTCQDVVAYSDSAFSATATVTCSTVGGYTEKFDIHMLFQNSGAGWQVTNFTFMK